MVKNTRGIPENAEKGSQAIPVHSWQLEHTLFVTIQDLVDK